MQHRRRLFSFPIIFLLLIPVFQSLTLTLSSTPFLPTRIQILQDILREVAAKQNWDLEGTEMSKLEVSRVRFGVGLSHEFRVGFGEHRLRLLVKYPDEGISWKNLNKSRNGDNFDDFVVNGTGSFAVLDTFKLDGPFDLRVSGHDELSLELPLNVSHTGLKRILVGEGISVEVKGAKEVSLFHRFDVKSTTNCFVANGNKTGLFPSWDSMCMPLLPVHVNGSGSLVAYKSWNPNVRIDRTFLSEGMIELLPGRCYTTSHVCKMRERSVPFLNLTVDGMEKALRGFVGEMIAKDGLLSFIASNVRASSMIQFLLEMENSFGGNQTRMGMAAEWRTRPSFERVWFAVTAQVEDNKLRPVMVKKVRPFIASHSMSLSNAMFNISFTKFPPILAPSEALTLGVKW